MSGTVGGRSLLSANHQILGLRSRVKWLGLLNIFDGKQLCLGDLKVLLLYSIFDCPLQFNKYLLSAYYVVDTVLGIWFYVGEKEDPSS